MVRLIFALSLATMLSPVARAAEHTDDSNGPALYLAVGFPVGFAASVDTDADFGVDYAGSLGLNLAAGSRLGRVRLEGQFTVQSVFVDSIDNGPGSPLPDALYEGDVLALGLMGNAFVDIGDMSGPRGYLGAGLGVSRLSVKYDTLSCFFLACATTGREVSGSDNATAWQAMAGVTFPRPYGETYLGYRYYATDSFTVNLTSGGTARHDGLQVHLVEFGFRFFPGRQ